MFLSTVFGIDAQSAALMEGIAVWAMMGLSYYAQTRLGIVTLERPSRTPAAPITKEPARSDELVTASV